MGDLAAVMDLGTNTFRLLVAEKTGDTITVIHRDRIFVKIGQGGISSGLIAPEAWQRAAKVIGEYANKIAAFGIPPERVLATATSAFRSAANGKEFIDDIRTKTGISIEIISGDQEAALIWKGVRSCIDMDQRTHLIMDIGGGSIEFIMANQQQIFWKQSFEIGAQRLYDRFHTLDPIPATHVEGLYAYLKDVLEPLTAAIKNYHPVGFIGSAGTFETLFQLYFQARNGNRIEPAPSFDVLPADGFWQVHAELLAKNKTERLAIPGMIPERVEMIVVASCAVAFLLRLLAAKEIIVSSTSLKDGLLMKVFES